MLQQPYNLNNRPAAAPTPWGTTAPYANAYPSTGAMAGWTGAPGQQFVRSATPTGYPQPVAGNRNTGAPMAAAQAGAYRQPATTLPNGYLQNGYAQAGFPQRPGLPGAAPIAGAPQNPGELELIESPFGTPGDMTKGGLIGVGMAGLLHLFATGLSPEDISRSPLAKLAHSIDTWPGFKQINNYLASQQGNIVQNPFLRRFFAMEAPESVANQTIGYHLNEFKDWVQTQHPDFQAATSGLTAPAANGVEAQIKHVQQQYQRVYNQLLSKDLQKELIGKRAKGLPNWLPFRNALPEWLENRITGTPKQVREALKGVTTVDGAKRALATSNAVSDDVAKRFMESLEKDVRVLAKKRYKHLRPALIRLESLRMRLVGGLDSRFFQPYQAEYNYLKGLGFSESKMTVGKGFASFFQYLQRVVGGEVAKPNFLKKMESNAPPNTFSPLGPFMAGMLVLSQSVMAWRKAEAGEKHKAFAEEMLGTGLGNFLGWEIGLKLLHSGQWVDRGVNALGKAIPFIGRSAALRRAPVLRFLTLAGFITEVLAMIVIAQPFEWVGKKLAHLVFGKPKSKDEKKAAATNPNYKPLQRNAELFQPLMKPTGKTSSGKAADPKKPSAPLTVDPEFPPVTVEKMPIGVNDILNNRSTLDHINLRKFWEKKYNQSIFDSY